MKPDSDRSKIMASHIFLKLKEPIIIEEKVKRIGIWIKGNSCWGSVRWMFFDASGERFTTFARQYWDKYQANYKLSINFDGWRFVSLELPHGNPDPDAPKWLRSSYLRSGGNNDSVVQFPIKVTHVAVAMREYQVYVTDMVPAQSHSIRLGRMIGVTQ